jgi:histidine triad (HIT) family protein
MNDFYCENVLNNRITVKKVKETDNVLAFYHTKPSWIIHIVIIPKKHIVNLLEADLEIIKEILFIAQEIIRELKLEKTNYKLIVNGGSFQDSQHLHFHLVSGKRNKNIGE